MFTFFGRLLTLGLWKPKKKVGMVCSQTVYIRIHMFKKNEEKILALCERYFQEDPECMLARLKNRGTEIGFNSESDAKKFFAELEKLLVPRIELLFNQSGNRVNVDFMRRSTPNWWTTGDVRLCTSCEEFTMALDEHCHICENIIPKFEEIPKKEVTQYEQKLIEAA